jgi:Ca2+-binding RTX toxin-like protein
LGNIVLSTISLVGGAEGNLARRVDVSDSGAGTDKVIVLFEAKAHSYGIFTYSGSDIVNTTKSNANNLNAALLGAGNDSFIGGAASDTVYDGSGNDKVSLGGGSDMVRVGTGDDVYDGGKGDDFVSFGFVSFDGTGMTINNSIGVSCDLSLLTKQDFGVFGKDIITGFENADGGDGNDSLYGTSGDNALYGMLGNDRLFGRSGNDKLNGGGGDDFLSGGRGTDIFYGEAGSDTIYCGSRDGAKDIIRYLGVTESDPNSGGVDIVYGFATGGMLTSDRIDLSKMDANMATRGVDDAFIFRSSGGFKSAGGEIMVVQSGPDAVVMIDTNGDSAVEMQIVLKGVHGLTAADFLL